MTAKVVSIVRKTIDTLPHFRRSYTWLFLLLISGTCITSCSVEKNTAATRNFHNLTSHYNIYFNASESFKEGLMRAEESIEDDFTTILPLFYYDDEAIQQSVSPQMKRAIDKCTKVITFHSIKAKPKVKSGRQTEKDKAFYDKKEYNKWVDDSYLLIGKAYMYQGAFFMAAETFNHVIRNFPGEDSYYLALAWLMRAYIMIGAMDEAEGIMIQLKDVEEFPEKEVVELYTSMTDYHMQRGAYDQAIPWLKKALDTRPKKSRRIRYRFILAQLQKEVGEGEASVKNFKKVVRMNPPYVMSFNAKVSMAEAFQSGSSGSSEIIKLLNKMLKDSKNREFRDQIYYALGNIYKERGEKERAINYYHLSASTSVQNKYQKGLSSLTLAEIYYNEPRYNLSAAYYDTAVNMLQDDYPNYNTLKIRSVSLNNLVRNIDVFELQDSIQRLAGMTESERFAVIDGIIDQIRKEEQEERLREQEARQDLQYARSGLYDNQQGSGGYNQQSGGKWYFYNLNAKSFGQPEFRMKWGERELEDNWRRSNKQSMAALLEEEGEEALAEIAGAEGELIDNKSREYYLRNIPLSDSAMAISHLKLEEALYNMAMIYREDLLDYEMAIESLEELISRYPDHEYTMESYYYLHELYNSVQQPSKADYYKELLGRKYPDSHMAMLLTNPDYIRQLEEEEQRDERFYEEVYEDYKNERYSQVIRKAGQGMERFEGDTEMKARLAYLRAMSFGAVSGKEAMKAELDSVVAMYPGTSLASEAQQVIDYMYVAFPVIREADQIREAKELYFYDPDADHRFALALKKSENLNLVNFNLLNYNLDHFNEYDLKIELKTPGVDYNLLVVDGFTGYEGVARYTARVRSEIIEIMGEIPPDAYDVVMISDENYKKLLEAKEVEPYLLFYKNNYKE
jgi:tetratricopeptide (TPR) repeat protein